MKLLSAIIAIAAAGPLMVDGNGQVLNWHGPHGGHHDFFEGVEYTHGGHSADAKVPYAEVMAELKQQKLERMEAAAAAEEHGHHHGHGDGNGHSHGHGHGHHGHGHHGARGGGGCSRRTWTPSWTW